jgi:hypothetical protein
MYAGVFLWQYLAKEESNDAKEEQFVSSTMDMCITLFFIPKIAGENF